MIFEIVWRLETLRTRIGKMSHKQRLLTLRFLPLTYSQELRHLVFLKNCISGYADKDIGGYVTFVIHGRSRSKNPTLVLKPAYCKTSTFQASFSFSCCHANGVNGYRRRVHSTTIISLLSLDKNHFTRVIRRDRRKKKFSWKCFPSLRLLFYYLFRIEKAPNVLYRRGPRHFEVE